jgi:predicted TIM-barrel fold metal-dependent hydrolase
MPSLRRRAHAPVLIKTSVDLLGADHVMAGSDWPIVDEVPIKRRAHRRDAGSWPIRRSTERRRLE